MWPQNLSSIPPNKKVKTRTDDTSNTKHSNGSLQPRLCHTSKGGRSSELKIIRYWFYAFKSTQIHPEVRQLPDDVTILTTKSQNTQDAPFNHRNNEKWILSLSTSWRHVVGCRYIPPLIFNLENTWKEWSAWSSGRFTSGKGPQVQTDMGLRRPKRRFGLFEGGKKYFVRGGNRTHRPSGP